MPFFSSGAKSLLFSVSHADALQVFSAADCSADKVVGSIASCSYFQAEVIRGNPDVVKMVKCKGGEWPYDAKNKAMKSKESYVQRSIGLGNVLVEGASPPLVSLSSRLSAETVRPTLGACIFPYARPLPPLFF